MIKLAVIQILLFVALFGVIMINFMLPRETISLPLIGVLLYFWANKKAVSHFNMRNNDA